MDRKQTIGIAAGVILLVLLVGPQFIPSDPAAPMTLAFVRYSVDADTGKTMVELKGENRTTRSLRCEMLQFEYLDSNRHWKPALQISIPLTLSFEARETKSMCAELPREATSHAWRIGMGCVVYPSAAEKYVAQALAFLKLRETDRSPSVSILQSEDFPPPPGPPLGQVVRGD